MVDAGTLDTTIRHDRDVIDLVRRGDANAALVRVMSAHGPGVYRYCREELRDGTLARDVHQQVFIAAFRCLSTFEGRSPVRAWLIGIARHRVLDAIKARDRDLSRVAEAGDEEAATAVDPCLAPDDALDDQRLRRALRVELSLLPEPTRVTIVLHYQHGLSIGEVASVLNEKPGTVSARVLRAMPLLRERIDARLGHRARPRLAAAR